MNKLFFYLTALSLFVISHPKIIIAIATGSAIINTVEAQHIVVQLGNGDTVHLNVIGGAKLWSFDSSSVLHSTNDSVSKRIKYIDTLNNKIMSVSRASDSIASIKSTIATLLSSVIAASTYQPIGTYSTASNNMSFTNKTGNVSQWTNDASYLTAIPAQSFGSLTGKPTTLSGYSITDAYPLTGNPSSFLIASDISGKRNISDSTGNNGTTPLWRLNKSRDSVVALIPSLIGYVQTTRTFSTTSPITGGGDLSSNRTIAINNAAADNSTKGAASFDANYFDDNGSGIISFAVTSGTGTVSANAVTINQPRGKITLSSPSVLAAATLSITLTNSFITSTSTINVGVNGNGSNITLGINCYIKSQTSGSCVINILNLSLLSTFTSSVIIDYLIVN